MAAGYLPLVIQQGETFSQQCTVDVAGVDMLTKPAAVAQVRTAAGAPVVLELTATIAPTDTDTAVATVSAPLAAVNALTPGGYVWDLFARSGPSDPAPLRLLAGPVAIAPRITVPTT